MRLILKNEGNVQAVAESNSAQLFGQISSTLRDQEDFKGTVDIILDNVGTLVITIEPKNVVV